MKELLVTEREAGQRLDHYLRKYLNHAPSGFLYKMLRKKNITLNGKRSAGSEITAAGDVVCLFLSDETISRFRDAGPSADSENSRGAAGKHPTAAPDIIWQNADILVVNKPPGILTQKAERSDVSLTEEVRAYFTLSGLTREGGFLPSPANRLDRNTSGIVLFGKSLRGQQYLTELIRTGKLKKEYLVIVKGSFTANGTYRVFYTKDEKKNRVYLTEKKSSETGEMITDITSLDVRSGYSLLLIRLVTGKPHQIRAHLSFLGYPVVGDRKYGDPDVNRFASQYGAQRQMLHAFRVYIPGDAEDCGSVCSTEQYFICDPPSDMKKLADRLNLILP